MFPFNWLNMEQPCTIKANYCIGVTTTQEYNKIGKRLYMVRIIHTSILQNDDERDNNEKKREKKKRMNGAYTQGAKQG
jgi:hypothetical protein